MKPKAILFDWDNTLVDTWPVIHAALERTFTAFGLVPWTFEETKARVRRSMRESFPPLFGDRWEEAGEYFYACFKERHLDGLTPCDGAEDMLRRLHDEGVYLGIVSNKNGDLLREEADHLGWTRYLGAVVGAFDATRDKPAVDPVDLALEGSGIVRGSDVWFAGDTGVDLECARNCGCVGVLVRTEPPVGEEFSVGMPTLHFPDCRALCNSFINL